ncbi:hypothetical protein C8K61_11295 [Pseudomonas sp. GV071]|nr:hypothetical protein C8K61_11295 [Pseudomonas sp. GV071]
MLKSLIAKLARRLFAFERERDYHIRITPIIGEPLESYNMMGFGPALTSADIEENLGLRRYDAPSHVSTNQRWQCDQSSFCDFNPASGLPMVCDAFDAGGNVFGTSES